MKNKKMEPDEIKLLIGRAIAIFADHPRQLTGDYFTRRELRVLEMRGIVRSRMGRQPSSGQAMRLWSLI